MFQAPPAFLPRGSITYNMRPDSSAQACRYLTHTKGEGVTVLKGQETRLVDELAAERIVLVEDLGPEVGVHALNNVARLHLFKAWCTPFVTVIL